MSQKIETTGQYGVFLKELEGGSQFLPSAWTEATRGDNEEELDRIRRSPLAELDEWELTVRGVLEGRLQAGLGTLGGWRWDEEVNGQWVAVG